MKRFIIFMLCLIALGTAAAQQQTERVDSKTFKAVKGTRSESSYTATDMVYIHTDGVKYTIYEHTFSKGARKGQKAYFVKMTSKKTGKSYWKEVKLS